MYDIAMKAAPLTLQAATMIEKNCTMISISQQAGNAVATLGTHVGELVKVR